MATCTICGEPIRDGSQACSLCGSRLEEFFPAATGLHSATPSSLATPMPTTLPPGGSCCPVCAKVYGPEYLDPFCECGTELVKQLPKGAMFEDVPMAPILDDIPMAPILDDEPAPDVKARGARPSPGTPCVVVYGPDKLPLQYFALTKDATLIGRLDAVAGNFPDIDLDEWFDRSITRRISRQHALILRSRATQTFALRPVAGNTGTQLETDMVQPQQDYPLRPGHRIVLGGVIRLKFEIA
jgi:hypothetical protein